MIKRIERNHKMSWKKVKIKDFLIRIKDIIPIEKDKEYNLVTIRLYHKGVQLRKKEFGINISAKKMSKVKRGQFILSGIDARNGAFGIVPPELDGAVVTNDFWYFNINERIVSKEYFLWLTSTPYFDDICKKASDGTTNRIRLQADRFYNQELLVPPIENQLKIVDELKKQNNTIDSLKKYLTHQLTLVKKLRQQLLQDAVQGKLVEQNSKDLPDRQAGEPASELLKKIKAEKQKLIAEQKLKKEKPLAPIKPEEIPFEIPKNWVWCRLGEITTLLTDGKHGDSKDQKDSGYYFLSAKDIQNGKFIYDNARQITYEDFIETHRRTALEPGDLCVVNTGATIGKTALAPDIDLTRKTTFQKSVAVIKILNHQTSMRFIEYFIKFETPKLLKASRGSAINNLLLGDMKNVVFPMPPLSEQKRIVQKLDQLMQYCNDLEASIKESESQNEKLLQQLLREALSPPASKSK